MMRSRSVVGRSIDGGVAGGAAIGPIGAFLAELLVPQLFGFAAVVLPVGLGLLGWKLFWCQPLRAPITRVIGTVLLLASLTGLLTLSLGTLTLRGEPAIMRPFAPSPSNSVG